MRTVCFRIVTFSMAYCLTCWAVQTAAELPDRYLQWAAGLRCWAPAKQTSGRLGNAPIIDAGQLSVSESLPITRRKSTDDDPHTKPTTLLSYSVSAVCASLRYLLVTRSAVVSYFSVMCFEVTACSAINVILCLWLMLSGLMVLIVLPGLIWAE